MSMYTPKRLQRVKSKPAMLKIRSPSREEELFRVLGLSLTPGHKATDRLEAGTNERKEVLVLEKWLNKTLKLAYADHSENPQKLVNETTVIYGRAFEELIRQVNVNCKERGQLLSKIWNSHHDLLQKCIRVQKTKEELATETHNLELESLRKECESAIKKEKETNFNLGASLHRLKNKLKYAEGALNMKKIREDKLLAQLQVVQQHYRAIKKEILILKEDNRILSTKLESCAYEVVHSKDGFLVPVPRADLRTFKKSHENLDTILMSDPILQDLSHAPDNLANEIESFGNI